MYASGKGHLDVVTILLDMGADINAKNIIGKLDYIISWNII